MTIYLDTSCAIALFVREPASARVLDWIEAARAVPVAISDWTRTEFASALGIKVRSRAMRAGDAATTLRRFRDTVESRFTVWQPDRTDFAVAEVLLERQALGLRAGDALHLAVARNRGAQRIVTLDAVMLRAARALGLPAANPLGR